MTMRPVPTLSFHGAVSTVTGSRYLLEHGDRAVLVDCGLFQGVKALRERNWKPPSFAPERVDAVVLTHAHIDHSGYLPRLCNDGFTGKVYCTQGTADLLAILLPDAGFLQEEEARHANKYGYARHKPALPLYTRDDAVRALDRLVPVAFDQPFEPAPGVTARLTRAGHIVGAACAQLAIGGVTFGFSGDVGRPHDPVMKAPDPMPPCDVLIVESTYGDRRHPTDDVADQLATIVADTVARGGALIVPAFAVGRAQHLLHLLARLRAAGRLPAVPIYLDSPMAIDATELYLRHRDAHRLDEDACRALGQIARYSHTPDDSRAIDRSTDPMIVISASGMATGGRVLHHLARFLPDPRSTVLLVGHQVAGTRGRSLLDGADELKLHGQYVPVRARIAQLEGLSAHVDHAEMIAWLRASGISPRRVYVTHGEPSAADAMRRRLQEAFGWDVVVPSNGLAAVHHPQP